MKPHKSTAVPTKPPKTLKKPKRIEYKEILASELKVEQYVLRPDGTFMNISAVYTDSFYVTVYTYTAEKLKFGTDEIVKIRK